MGVNCPRCGSSCTDEKNPYRSDRYVFKRFHCQKCGNNFALMVDLAETKVVKTRLEMAVAPSVKKSCLEPHKLLNL